MEEAPFFTSIIDPRTFVIHGKTLEAGDVIDLTEEEEIILQWVRNAEAESLEIRQDLVNYCVKTEREAAIEVARKAHRLNWLSSEIKSKIFSLVNRLHDRLGGQVPLTLEKDLSKIVVRPARLDQESVNYTASRIRAMLGLQPLMPAITIAKEIVNKYDAEILVDVRTNKELEFQPILVRRQHGAAETPGWDGWVETVSAALLKHRRCPTILIVPDFETWDIFIMLGPDPRQPDRANAVMGFAKEKRSEHLIVVSQSKDSTPKNPIYTITEFWTKSTKAIHAKIHLPPEGEDGEVSVGEIEEGPGCDQEGWYRQILQG